jgi:hypothetical protein
MIAAQTASALLLAFFIAHAFAYQIKVTRDMLDRAAVQDHTSTGR